MTDQRQLSPDGRWWWDGQKWQPVEQAPPQQAPPPQKPSHRGQWFAVGVVALIVLLGLCVTAVVNSSSQPKPAASAAPVAAATPKAATATPTAAPAAAPTKDGSCAPQPCANDNYGWMVLVGNFKYDAPGGSFSQPEAGNVFVTMDVTFTNRLDREQHANPTQFVLLDGSGIKHTLRPFLDGPCTTWSPVNVTKGGSFGPKCLSFEAAAGKPSGLALVWTPSGFGGGYNMKLS